MSYLFNLSDDNMQNVLAFLKAKDRVSLLTSLGACALKEEKLKDVFVVAKEALQRLQMHEAKGLIETIQSNPARFPYLLELVTENPQENALKTMMSVFGAMNQRYHLGVNFSLFDLSDVVLLERRVDAAKNPVPDPDWGWFLTGC